MSAIKKILFLSSLVLVYLIFKELFSFKIYLPDNLGCRLIYVLIFSRFSNSCESVMVIFTLSFGSAYVYTVDGPTCWKIESRIPYSRLSLSEIVCLLLIKKAWSRACSFCNSVSLNIDESVIGVILPGLKTL